MSQSTYCLISIIATKGLTQAGLYDGQVIQCDPDLIEGVVFEIVKYSHEHEVIFIDFNYQENTVEGYILQQIRNKLVQNYKAIDLKASKADQEASLLLQIQNQPAAYIKEPSNQLSMPHLVDETKLVSLLAQLLELAQLKTS